MKAAAEIELKFQIFAAAADRLGEHAAWAEPARTDLLRSVYFDTPGHALWKAGLSLRVRETDGGFVQTVKQQTGANTVERGEWETAVAGPEPDMTALAGTPVAEHLGDEAVGPIFATTAQRTQRLWSDGAGSVEISLDVGEITAGSLSEPIHELELELKSGAPAALFALARDLADLAPLRLSFASKAERGYELVAGEGPAAQKARPIDIPPMATVADSLRLIGWNCLAQVARNAEIVRAYRRPEALHQARVGLRRFRAAFTAFKPMIVGDDFTALKAETEWLAGELDAARDIDVFIHETFRPAEIALEDRTAAAKLGAHLLQAQTEAYAQALTALRSERYDHFLLAAALWLETGVWTTSDEPVQTILRDSDTADFARERLSRLRRQVLKRGRKLASLDAAARHHLRIKIKKLRYAAEFFSDSLPGAGAKKTFLKMLETLQDHLGQANDAVVGHRLAADLVQDQPADAAFAAGLIVGARATGAGSNVEEMLAAFAAFKAAKPFWR